MATRVPVPQIAPSPAVNLSIVPLDDAAETTIITVQHPGPPTYMQAYAMTRAGVVTSIGRDDALGKANSGAMRRFRDGTGRLIVSEADAVPLSSGSTSDVTYYDFPGAFPPQSAPSGGIDQATLDRITALEATNKAQQTQIVQLQQALAGHETRLDRIATGATG